MVLPYTPIHPLGDFVFAAIIVIFLLIVIPVILLVQGSTTTTPTLNGPLASPPVLWTRLSIYLVGVSVALTSLSLLVPEIVVVRRHLVIYVTLFRTTGHLTLSNLATSASTRIFPPTILSLMASLDRSLKRNWNVLPLIRLTSSSARPDTPHNAFYRRDSSQTPRRDSHPKSPSKRYHYSKKT